MAFVCWRVWGSVERMRRAGTQCLAAALALAKPLEVGGVLPSGLSALGPPSSGVPQVMPCPSPGPPESSLPGSFLLTALLGAGSPCACLWACLGACWRPFSRVSWAGELLLPAALPVGQLQAGVEEGRGHALGCGRVAGTEELLTCALANAWKRNFTIHLWKLLNLLHVKFATGRWPFENKIFKSAMIFSHQSHH